MTLSVCKLWIGFDKSVDDMVVMVANKGMPTEQRWALGPWCAIDGGIELSRRGAKLLRKQLFVDDVPSEIEEGAERPYDPHPAARSFSA
jgi:hypothetical protein